MQSRSIGGILKAPRRQFAVVSDAPAQSLPAPSSQRQNVAPPSSTAPKRINFSKPLDFPSRRAPKPLSAEEAESAQKIYLPNIIIRLVRNSPREKGNPYIATFKVPPQLTKPDIVSYLAQVYGLRVTSISTILTMGPKVRARLPGQWKSISRERGEKKAIVGLEEPFWYPTRRPDTIKNMSNAYVLRGREIRMKARTEMGRGKHSWRWRGNEVRGTATRFSSIVKRIHERRKQQEQAINKLAYAERASLSKSLQGTAASV